MNTTLSLFKVVKRLVEEREERIRKGLMGDKEGHTTNGKFVFDGTFVLYLIVLLTVARHSLHQHFQLVSDFHSDQTMDIR